MSEQKRKKWEFPHVFIILFGLIVLVALTTYIIPAGEYDRVENADGRTVVVDGTYHLVESNPTSFFGIFKAVHEGMVQGSSIIFFILIVGGAFGILSKTNAIEGTLGSLSRKMAGKEIYLIPVIMIFFALAGATFGMAEETIPFILILVPLAIRMGFDSMVGTAIVFVGAYTGFGAAFLNPFTVGVAQGIAELPLFSGLGVRIIVWVLFVTISIIYVVRYARKVKKDPKASIMYEEDRKRDQLETDLESQPRMTKKHALIMGILVATLVGLAFGVIVYEWYITEIAALFLIMGITVGLIARLRVNQIATSFIKGCEEIITGALVVGLAYGILIVLENSFTIDTILYTVSGWVASLPTQLTVLGMYVTQCALNFVVPSGSGQAALTMPIMTPLADLTGVSRQTAVSAFQIGDGISNMLTPTNGAFMAGLAIAKISWTKWVKWIWPLLLIQYVVGGIVLIILHMFIWPA